MISAQNTRLPHLGSDLREPHCGPVATIMGAANLLEVMKPTCDEAGNWRHVPATEIDPGHRYANPKETK